jgi:hypothetical protein
MLNGLTWLLVPEGAPKPLPELSSAVVLYTDSLLALGLDLILLLLEAGFSGYVGASGMIVNQRYLTDCLAPAEICGSNPWESSKSYLGGKSSMVEVILLK